MVQTQWRVGMNIVGLDYNAVYLVARTLGVNMDADLLRRLQTLEGDFLAERQEQQSKSDR